MKISKMAAVAALIAPLFVSLQADAADPAAAPANGNYAAICAQNADENGLQGDGRDSYIADCVDQMGAAAEGDGTPPADEAAPQEAPQEEMQQEAAPEEMPQEAPQQQ